VVMDWHDWESRVNPKQAKGRLRKLRNKGGFVGLWAFRLSVTATRQGVLGIPSRLATYPGMRGSQC